MTLESTESVTGLASRMPPSFTLGVAAAAFQIEGALSAGGRGPSGWDAFAQKPGTIVDGHSPATACDHYNRLDAGPRGGFLPLLAVLAAHPA